MRKKKKKVMTIKINDKTDRELNIKKPKTTSKTMLHKGPTINQSRNNFTKIQKYILNILK